MMRLVYIVLLPLAVCLAACDGTVIPSDPVKEMKKRFESKLAYTVILADMDLVGDQYKHKYQVIELMPDQSVVLRTTEWEDVTDDFFLLHETDLGMEVLSKKEDGTINNLVSPPGFTNFVGDERFGYWYTESEQLYWRFRPEYDTLNAALGLHHMKMLRTEYEEFRDSYLFNRPFYGESMGKDSTKYGTYSHYSVIRWPYFYQRKSLNKNFEKESYSTVYSDDRGGGGTGK